jgi:SAM-dependent methyltransferase
VFLESVVTGSPWRYLGIDSSPLMIDLARERLEEACRVEPAFRVQELTDTPVLTASDGFYDLVVIFGVLHHVPSSESRRRLLADTAASLSPGAVLVMSFWQFGDRQRFRDRVIPWSAYNRHAEDQIEERQLEPGDVLLAWGDGAAEPGGGDAVPGPCRYCHFATPSEADSLVADLDLEIVDRFAADGRSGDLNLYFVLRRDRNSSTPIVSGSTAPRGVPSL